MVKNYVDETELEKLPEENRENIKKTIAKYSYEWWNSEDIIEAAMYQLFEGVLLIDFSVMHEGISNLLARPVYNTEFGTGFGVEELQEEALVAYQYYLMNDKQIMERTEEEKLERVVNGLTKLAKFCQEHNKALITIDPNDTFEDILKKIKEK